MACYKIEFMSKYNVFLINFTKGFAVRFYPSMQDLTEALLPESLSDDQPFGSADQLMILSLRLHISFPSHIAHPSFSIGFWIREGSSVDVNIS